MVEGRLEELNQNICSTMDVLAIISGDPSPSEMHLIFEKAFLETHPGAREVIRNDFEQLVVHWHEGAQVRVLFEDECRICGTQVVPGKTGLLKCPKCHP